MIKINKSKKGFKALSVRSQLSVGKTCKLEFESWLGCYIGWLQRGGGVGKPDEQYYACKETCNS